MRSETQDINTAIRWNRRVDGWSLNSMTATVTALTGKNVMFAFALQYPSSLNAPQVMDCTSVW
jgi:hypothetical protein